MTTRQISGRRWSLPVAAALALLLGGCVLAPVGPYEIGDPVVMPVSGNVYYNDPYYYSYPYSAWAPGLSLGLFGFFGSSSYRHGHRYRGARHGPPRSRWRGSHRSRSPARSPGHSRGRTGHRPGSSAVRPGSRPGAWRGAPGGGARGAARPGGFRGATHSGGFRGAAHSGGFRGGGAAGRGAARGGGGRR